ncbi:MAG: hypothetical protein RIQ81_412 [Pseudomonadota bacterium]
MLKACESKIQALVRLSETDTVAVRGVFSEIATLEGYHALRIGGVSAKGVEFLGKSSQCFVELVMMNSKVVFGSFIVKLVGDSVYLALPTELVNIERRKNARYPIPPTHAAFFCLSSWLPKATDPVAPPVVTGFDAFLGWIKIGDISMGGFSAQMLVPGPRTELERGVVDEAATIRFPGQEPIVAPSIVRWTKRIADWTGNNAENKYTRVFKIGCEFREVSPALNVALKQAIRDFSTAGAV